MTEILEPLGEAQIAVFVSGEARGSNMQALLDACMEQRIKGEVRVVIGTRAEAPALTRAREAGVAVHVVSPKKYEGQEEAYAHALLRLLRRYEINLVCLAGYLLRLPAPIVAAYSYRVLNIHPALLPLFGGKGMYGRRVHEAVIESGMKVTGCTVHFVDNDYDTGPILVQRAIPVFDEDTPETLAARLLPEEHRAYVEAVDIRTSRWLCVKGRRVLIYDPFKSC
ncbi:phosphoribosylglycinamide formyltransferase [Chthonomonas calidirosea]|uniref:phosphoribosylglycinamide formyltransferase n=1 Tax=Chthonomonas calidirosea TaxID=454171 RepID=UPI0009488E69|nr:phosphoribosylglycinamide formyltransferase [Chthonomonas calidirosea]